MFFFEVLSPNLRTLNPPASSVSSPNIKLNKGPLTKLFHVMNQKLYVF